MRKKKKSLIFIITILIMCFGIGYAYLTTTLSINGVTDVDANNWNVYFDNVQITDGSVTGDQVTTAPSIDSIGTTVSYHIRLKEPGEYYEFTVDVVNAGTIDAMIESINSKMNNNPLVELPAYLNYNITYADGAELLEFQELNAGVTESIKVRIEYNNDLAPEDLPSSAQSLSFSFSIGYVQKDSNAIEVDHVPLFQIHSMETILLNIRSGNIQDYHLGDTKTIKLSDGSNNTLRIINTSTPAECSQTGFSQTGCGFVVEMFQIAYPQVPFCTALGASNNRWDVSPYRSYLNNDVINLLPDIIRNNILDTYVVSSDSDHNESVVTTDKLFLLDFVEIVGETLTDSGVINNSRQFDYFESLGIRIGVNQALIRRTGATRTPYNNNMYIVFDSGTYDGETKFCTSGYSAYVAFRLG
ncbi:MAG: hypothetical protein IKQ06_00735 [Bacilli bacterium]|nr:hypothetical protein [Bacilli bacterium]MBR6136660.1 hypothetical protein [Bacilli bacterium]